MIAAIFGFAAALLSLSFVVGAETSKLLDLRHITSADDDANLVVQVTSDRDTSTPIDFTSRRTVGLIAGSRLEVYEARCRRCHVVPSVDREQTVLPV